MSKSPNKKETGRENSSVVRCESQPLKVSLKIGPKTKKGGFTQT